MNPKSLLIIDIETDSLDIKTANLKWFGAYSYKHDKYYLLSYEQIDKINSLIDSHAGIIGFNTSNYDIPILEKYGVSFAYKLLIDLYTICSPKGKNRLGALGIKLKSYSLKEIIKELGLDDFGKGDIDYKIFQKETWTEEEVKEIKKYLKQDIVLTKKLFDWLDERHAPLKDMLSQRDAEKLSHLTTTTSSLAYRIMCNLCNLDVLWADWDEEERKTFLGGHHILPRFEKVKGNIVYIDFNSAYPHVLFQGNLFDRKETGWDGDGYFKIEGRYNSTKESVPSKALKSIYLKRVAAKKKEDKIGDAAYKIIINSFYGTIGNSLFKQFYDPTAASDCTSMVRTLLKKCAKTLEENDYSVLYGFTDGMFVLIPPESDEEELMLVVRGFLDEAKKHFPFPSDTFDMSVDKRVKFIWFIKKKANCYLWVNQDNTIGYTHTLLNSTAPKLAIQLFDEFIGPRIIKTLEVEFTEEEIESKIVEYLNKDISLAAQEHKVKDVSAYKVATSLQHQISERYGEGSHLLIPNKKGVGVGRGKHTIKSMAVRYCSIDEFKEKGLKVEDICIASIMRYFKPFYEVNSDE